MARVIETALIALLPGSFEGLLAVAIVLTFRSAGVINVALGGVAALGAVATALLAPQVGEWPAVLLGLAVAVSVAVGTSNLVSRAGTGPLNPLPVLAALGVAVVIEQVVSQLWPAGLQFPDLIGQRIFNVGPYELTPLHAAGLIAGLIAIATSAAVLGRIRGERARMLGLALAGLIAGVSGCLAAQAGFGPGYMVVPALVAALAAAIARFRRLELAFLAAIAIELARTFSVRYDLPHAGYTAGVALVLIGALALYGAYYLAGSVRGAGGRIRL